MDALQAVLNNLVQFYSELPECRAVALIGSRAEGTAKSWSDVNLMLVMFSQPDRERRLSLIQKLTSSQQRFRCTDSPFPTDRFDMGGYSINVWHISQDLICDRVASISKGRRLESTMIIAILHDCKILWDSNNQLRAWRNRITPVPEKYKLKVIPVVFSEITNVVEDIARAYKKEESLFFIQHEILAALRVIYEIIFLINNRYLNLTRRVDSVITTFEHLPPEFLTRVNDILLGPSDSEGVRRKWRLLAEIIKQIGRFLEDLDPRYQLSNGWAQLQKAAPFVFKELERSQTGKIRIPRNK